MALNFTSIITASKFKRVWEEGKARVWFHEVWFEKQDGDEPFLIGAKKENPDWLEPGQFLTFEMVDKAKRRIKRISKGESTKVVEKPNGALIRAIEKFNEGDLIFMDIETARVQEEIKEGTPLYDAWAYFKSRHLTETESKVTLEEYYIDKAALYPPFARVVAIVAGSIVDDKLKIKKYFGPDEKAMLAEFNEDIETALDKNSKKVFCGWANNTFDQPFLAKRMVINGIKPNLLCDTAHLKPWEVASLDLKDIWKGTSPYPDSLVAVSTALGLPSPKAGMDGSKVGEAFYAGKIEEIAKYCAGDVLTVANVWRKLKNNGGSVTL